jgi:hypothetical protein
MVVLLVDVWVGQKVELSAGVKVEVWVVRMVGLKADMKE